MTEGQAVEKPKKRLIPPGCSLVLAAYLIVWGSYCLTKLATWSDPWAGLANGVLHGIVLAPLLVIVAAIHGIVYLVVRKTRLRARTQWLIALSPALLIAGLAIGGLLIDPPTATDRFQWMMGTPVPDGAREFRASYSGGGFTDFLDIYCFESDRNSIDRFLGSRAYQKVKDPYVPKDSPLPVIGRPPQGWPDPSLWKNVEVYKFEKGRGEWFYYVIVNGTHTKVYIVAGCI